MSYQIALFGIASKFISAEVGFNKSKKKLLLEICSVKIFNFGYFFSLVYSIDIENI